VSQDRRSPLVYTFDIAFHFSCEPKPEAGADGAATTTGTAGGTTTTGTTSTSGSAPKK